ncbi:hypothetical protein LX32DRAFT_642240 [Colletotrichum zoysiae]|uniref:Uncharacterized protein n=1 Tax=Colletotrichum zoysiae TaxID=1216348 RepID=A0AAD9HBW5_9PEZI|nr:hypothetical protein LX32DRAFT_642240 [Colletotrichum zoysiae]
MTLSSFSDGQKKRGKEGGQPPRDYRRKAQTKVWPVGREKCRLSSREPLTSSLAIVTLAL